MNNIDRLLQHQKQAVLDTLEQEFRFYCQLDTASAAEAQAETDRFVLSTPRQVSEEYNSIHHPLIGTTMTYHYYPPLSLTNDKKETTMSNILSASLIPKLLILAGKGEKDEFEHFDRLPVEFQEVLEKKKAAQQAAAIEELAEVALTLYKSASDKEKALVEQVRALRLNEKGLLAQLAALKAAKEQAEKSQNFLPLAVCLNPSLTHHINPEDLVTEPQKAKTATRKR